MLIYTGMRIGISIHAPRTGSDFKTGFNTDCVDGFQSTLPVRGATRPGAFPPNDGYFNPRSPYGERLWQWRRRNDLPKFQSTLPVRGATPDPIVENLEALFQSTLPVRGATFFQQIAVNGCCISIHAPRTGSDLLAVLALPTGDNFNPRSPYGERRLVQRLH